MLRSWALSATVTHSPSGHASDVRTHAELCLWMTETAMLELGWPLSEKAQTEIDDKKRKPSKESRIETMRDAVEFAQRTSARGRGKAVRCWPPEALHPVKHLVAVWHNLAGISGRQGYYAVPVRCAGRRLAVRLSVRTVVVFDGPKRVANHERAFGRYVEVLLLDHYLEVLKTKPGGLPGATALVQAKASGAFTGSHQRYWDAVRRVRGDGAGTRALVEVLLAHRSMPTAVLVAAMDRAVDTGCLDPQVVLIDARRDQAGHLAPVIPIAALAKYDRPAPSLADYDQLLTARSTT